MRGDCRCQLEMGAIGISVATMAEAEVMARAGIRGVLITGEVVGEPKISRLMRLFVDAPDTLVVVDDASNLEELQRPAGSVGARIPVLIDLEVGHDRTGVRPEHSSGLAEHIDQAGNLEFKGVSAYAGHASHVLGFDAGLASSRVAP